MIKRLTKSKKSKKGAILVIVVLILALAMIFIASAIMLTQATRRRLYSTAMQSQARLTVTAASEVFLEALNMQEITDTQLEAIMGKTHGPGKQKVKMVVENVPGMSTASNNCTYLDVYPDPTDSNFVYCDFTTVIGTETENVQVVLKAEESDPSFGSQFKNQVEVAGAVGVGELRFTNGCGMWDPACLTSRPTDNTVVIRGNYTGQTSSSKYLSDVVFGQGSSSVQLGGGEMFFGRVIFLQGATMYNRSSAEVYGDVYLIGTNNSAGLKVNSNQGGMWDQIKGRSGQRFIFSGRSVQNDTTDQNHKIKEALTVSGRNVYFLDSDGKSLGTSHNNAKGQSQSNDTYTVTNAAGATGNTVSTDNITNNVKTYQKYKYQNSGEHAFPSADQVFGKLCVDGKTAVSTGAAALGYETYTTDGTHYAATETIPAGKKYYLNPVTKNYPTDAFFTTTDSVHNPRPQKRSLDLSSATSQNLPAGYYKVTGSCTGSKSNPIVLGIDGSQGDKYRFYFSGNIWLRGVVFAIYNADATKPVICVLEPGAKIQLSHANDRLGATDNNLLSAGFLSVPNREGFDSYENACSYIRTTKWSEEKKDVTNSAYKFPSNYNGDQGTANQKVSVSYSSCYDNKVRPAFFIYGAGSNVICMGSDVTIEAYIGLYGGSGFGPINDAAQGDHQQIYGRVECSAFRTYDQNFSFSYAGNDNPVGGFAMPYCPQPLSTSTIPKQRLAVSKYKVADIIYYYDTGSSASTT